MHACMHARFHIRVHARTHARTHACMLQHTRAYTLHTCAYTHTTNLRFTRRRQNMPPITVTTRTRRQNQE